MNETPPSGLTSKEALAGLKKYGPNRLPDNKTRKILKAATFFISPISLMLLAAALLSFYIGREFDGYFIFFLLLLNFAISFWQEQKADNAIKKLNEHLSIFVRTLRDGKFEKLDSSRLVPGDIIELSLGDVVPADSEVTSSKGLLVNDSTLTGESLPKEKKQGEKIYSGSFVVSGSAILTITNTGRSTYFGKTFSLAAKIQKKSVLEQDILSISKFLSLLSVAAVVVLSVVSPFKHQSLPQILALDLSLLIAGIPISLPTVMTLIIEIGVLSLAVKKVIVRRISSLEDLSNVSMLLTDKTGTLTENKIKVTTVHSYSGFNENQVLSFAGINALNGGQDPIDVALVDSLVEMEIKPQKNDVIDFKPFDFKSKTSSSNIKLGNKEFMIVVGAPQAVIKLCKQTLKESKAFEGDVMSLANKGYRSLAVAIKETSKKDTMRLAGVIGLSDTVRSDARSVIAYLSQNSVNVAMLTGDNRVIAKQVAQVLGFPPTTILTREGLLKLGYEKINEEFLKSHFVYSEILPEDKLNLVKQAKKFFVTAVTGDGINDLPASKAADVGIAVKTAVDAMKNSADIILLGDGIAVIKDAIFEARKIFTRIYSYSVYRISESLRLILTIALIGLFNSAYPLTVLQILLLALLNDIPIISLAYDNVEVPHKPSKIDVKKRFLLSSSFGLIGVINSIIVFVVLKYFLNLPWPIIQTVFFLKLTVSGHMLIFVAHTKRAWYKFLPSKQVIIATLTTQAFATLLALTGFLMPAKISIEMVIAVWVWAFFWMQISEFSKSFT